MMKVGYRGPVAVLLALVLAWASCSPAALAEGSRNRTAAAPARAVPLETRLELMLRTMKIARDWHIEAPSRSALIAGAIEGLLARVDPEAELYTRADLRRIARFAIGPRAGVGLEVRRDPPERRAGRKGYRVVTARDGSPAARVGLKAGDLITHIDGQPAGEIPYLAMTRVLLEGAPGATIRLAVERAGSDQAPEDIVLERTASNSVDVSVDEVATGITRVRIAALSATTAADLSRSWGAYVAGSDGARRSRGVVLDLRSTAVAGSDGVRAVADAFLQSGPVLRTASRSDGGDRQESAKPGDLVDGRPIVVLVDGGTSGGAEMLASALQEGRRARLVGTKTAGRGALRTLVALDRNGRKGILRLTTERLLTPSGAAIEGKGVTPDIVIDQLPASSACRTLDIEDEAVPGWCVPRTVAQDTQLQRAISTLDEPLVAAQQDAETSKP